jgi:cell wall-associated NlpC family hydrolase
VVSATFAFAPQAAAEPSSVASKEAQVQRVLAQIESLDASLSRAIEAYNLASDRLEQVKADLRQNAHHLAVARSSLRRAQRLLAARAVALYTSSEDQTTFAVLLGATSLDDFLARVETVNRVSTQDENLQTELVAARSEIVRRRGRLRRARAWAAHLVEERAAHKASIEQQLAERRDLVASIRAEIERIKAEEARRQAELARQARERASAQALTPTLAPTISTGAEESAEVTAAPAALPSGRGGVVGIAMQYLGTPYRWGGSSPSTGFDCSGFVMYVFGQVGVSLPHSTYAIYGMGMPVSRGELQPGDLVFFNGLGHMGIYIGGNQMIHSPHTGDVVKISSLSGWYASTYVGARRV